MADLGVTAAQVASILGPATRFTPGQTIRYTFFSALPDISTYSNFIDYQNYFGKPAGSSTPFFSAFSESEQGKVREILDTIERITTVHFEPVAINDNPDIRIGISNLAAAKAVGVNFPLNATNDIFIDVSVIPQLALGQLGYTTILHEIAHSFGLLDTSKASPALTFTGATEHRITVMSDDELPPVDSYGITPLVLDIAALQARLGQQTGQSLRDQQLGIAGSQDSNRYQFNPDPNVSANQPYVIYSNQVKAIWDAGGDADVFDASAYQSKSSRLHIDLEPGHFSSIGARNNIALALAAPAPIQNIIENAVGGAGSDELLGNSIANKLAGMGGADELKGGGGSDTYVFTGSPGEGGSGEDTILDDGQGDRIVLDAQIVDGQFEDKPAFEGTFTRALLVSGLYFDASDASHKLWFEGSNFNQPGDLVIEHSGGKIRVKNWSQGKYGINLSKEPTKSELGQAGSKNGWENDPTHEPDSGLVTQIEEFGGKLLKLFFNKQAQAGDKAVFNLAGASEQVDYGLLIGDQLVSFANGQIEIELAGGQTEEPTQWGQSHF
jgi:hypothetical protein